MDTFQGNKNSRIEQREIKSEREDVGEPTNLVRSISLRLVYIAAIFLYFGKRLLASF